jgi:CxxC-x17-CxxC domain-containing protein
MGNFNRGGGFGGGRGGRPSFGGGRRDGGRGFGRGFENKMHKTICSECGNSCEVPFRPTGDKPVFCNDCFKKQGGGSHRDGGFQKRDFRGDFGRQDFANSGSIVKNDNGLSKKIEELSSKIDKLTEMFRSFSVSINKTNEDVTLKDAVEFTLSKKENDDSVGVKKAKKKSSKKAK